MCKILSLVVAFFNGRSLILLSLVTLPTDIATARLDYSNIILAKFVTYYSQNYASIIGSGLTIVLMHE